MSGGHWSALPATIHSDSSYPQKMESQSKCQNLLFSLPEKGAPQDLGRRGGGSFTLTKMNGI